MFKKMQELQTDLNTEHNKLFQELEELFKTYERSMWPIKKELRQTFRKLDKTSNISMNFVMQYLKETYSSDNQRYAVKKETVANTDYCLLIKENELETVAVILENIKNEIKDYQDFMLAENKMFELGKNGAFHIISKGKKLYNLFNVHCESQMLRHPTTIGISSWGYRQDHVIDDASCVLVNIVGYGENEEITAMIDFLIEKNFNEEINLTEKTAISLANEYKNIGKQLSKKGAY